MLNSFHFVTAVLMSEVIETFEAKRKGMLRKYPFCGQRRWRRRSCAKRQVITNKF